MSARGSYQPAATIYDSFNTFNAATGSLITLSGGSLTIIRNGGAATTTTGGSLTTDAGGVTGLHHVAIDTSDGSFYLGQCDYAVRITGSAGTVNAAGVVVTTFSLGKNVADARMLAGETVAMGAGGTASIGAKGELKVAISDAAIDRIADEPLSGHTTAGTIGAEITKTRQFVVNRAVTNIGNGLMELYDDDSSAVAFSGSIWLDAGGTLVYDGSGPINRRDKMV